MLINISTLQGPNYPVGTKNLVDLHNRRPHIGMHAEKLAFQDIITTSQCQKRLNFLYTREIVILNVPDRKKRN
jgi:hypothetical protein